MFCWRLCILRNKPTSTTSATVHQHLAIDINLDERSLTGVTEITLQPLASSLSVLRFNSRECKIHRAFVNGLETPFFLKEYRPLSTLPDGLEQLKRGGAEIKSHLSNPEAMLEYEDGELAVTIPPGVLIEPQATTSARPMNGHAMLLSRFANSAAATAGAAGVDDTASRVSELNSHHGDAEEDEAEYATLLVRIEFSCVEPSSGGIWFIDDLSAVPPSDLHPPLQQQSQDRVRHFAQMYTNTMPVPCSARHNMLPVSGSARYIFPCLDKVHERCTWLLDVTVPAKLPEDMSHATDDQTARIEEHAPEDSEHDDVLVVATGRLVSQLQHDLDPDKRVFRYAVDIPVSAPMLSIAVGAFDMHTIALDIPTATVPVEVDLSEARKAVPTAAAPAPDAVHDAVGEGEDGSVIGRSTKSGGTATSTKETASVTFYPPRAIQVFCEHHHSAKISHSCALLDQILDYYSDVFGMYPFSDFQYHKVVFVDDLDTGVAAHGAGITLLNTQLLCDADNIEKTFEQRRTLMQALAVQWFGMHVLPKTWGDFWVTMGLAQFMVARFFRHHFGKNEYKFRLKKDFQRLAALDVQLPPLYYTPHPSQEFLHIKSSLVCYALDKRMIKVAASAGLTALIQRILTVIQFATIPAAQLRVGAVRDLVLTPQNVGERMLSTGAFQRWIKRFNGMEGIKSFFDQWVNFPGVPRLEFTFSCNTTRGVIEFDMTQESTSVWGLDAQVPPTVFTGQLGVLIKEIDGVVYPHIFEIARATQHLEAKFYSRFKYKLKQGKTKAVLDDDLVALEHADGDAADPESHVVDEHDKDNSSGGSTLDTDLPEFDWSENKPVKMDFSGGFERPDLVHKYVQWVQIDADMEWICPITLKQHDYQWGRLLKNERDLSAQFDAVMHLRHYPSPRCSTALFRAITDHNLFYRIRADAALALPYCAVPETNWIGLEHLMGLYALWFGYARSKETPLDVVPRPNNWVPFADYYVRKALIFALSTIKNERGMSPRQLKLFVLNQLRCNDNRCNQYSDHEYIAHLVQCLCLVFLRVSPHHHHLFPGDAGDGSTRVNAAAVGNKTNGLAPSGIVPDKRVITSELAKVEVMDLGIGFDSESDTDGEGENGVRKPGDGDVVKNVGKFKLQYGADDDLFDEAVAEVDKLRLLELLTPTTAGVITSACLMAICRWMMAGMMPVHIDIFLEYTGYEYPVKVRTTAFDCVLLLEGCFVNEIADYLFSVVLTDPSPFIRLHVCRGFVSFARVSGAEDRGSLRERRKVVFEKLRLQFAEKPHVQRKLWAMASGDGQSIDQRARDLLLDFCDLVLGNSLLVPRFRFKNIQKQVVPKEPVPDVTQRPAVDKIVHSKDRNVKLNIPYQGYPPSKRLGPVDATLLNKGIAVIERLKDHPCSQAFMDPVDPVHVPTYYTIITEPMDISAAEKKLKNGHYSIIEGLFYDIRLIFRNCYKFNTNENSDLWKQAKKLEAFFENSVVPNAMGPSTAKTPTGGPMSLTASTEAAEAASQPAAGGGGGNRVVARGQMDVEDLRRCKRMARRLREHMAALPFLKPVTGVPGYYDVVKNPMDLSTIRHKLDGNEYASRQGFESDVRLVLRNCFTFNPPDDEVYHAGKELESFFDKEWHMYFPPPPVTLRLPQLAAGVANAALSPSPTPPPLLDATPAAPDAPAPEASAAPPSFTIRVETTNSPEPAVTEPATDNNQGDVARSARAQSTISDAPSADVKPFSRELKLCRRVLKHLESSPDAVDFLAPVDPIAMGIPDYPKVIKHPMDLSTVKRKLKRGDYSDHLGFRSDVMLMLNNAFTFNSPQTIVYQAAVRLKLQFDREWKTNVEAKLDSSSHPESQLRRASVASAPDQPGNVKSESAAVPSFKFANKVPVSTAPPKVKMPLNIKNRLRDILRTVAIKPFSAAFLHPVDPIALGIPHYRTIIKEPMDIATIRRKLETDQYSSAKEFDRDFVLMLENCFTFNPPDDIVYLNGKELEAFYHAQMRWLHNKPAAAAAPAPAVSSEKTPVVKLEPAKPAAPAPASALPALPPPPPAVEVQRAAVPSAPIFIDTEPAAAAPPSTASTSSSSAGNIEVTKDLRKSLERVVRKMKEHSLAWPFLQPVDPVRDGVPQYFEFIKRPMDMTTLERNLHAHKYTTLGAFEADARLIFHNCYTFNGVDHDISRWARQIEDQFDSDWWPKVVSTAQAVQRRTSGSVSSKPAAAAPPLPSSASRPIPSALSIPPRPAFDKTKARKILGKLQKHLSAWPFRTPVDWRALNIPTYPDIVKRPMDLSTIEQKINRKQYTLMQDFVADVKLMLNNCFIFNRPGDPVYVCGQEIELAFEVECRKFGVSLEVISPQKRKRSDASDTVDDFGQGKRQKPTGEDGAMTPLPSQSNDSASIHHSLSIS
ncbi:hypothetical protein RI367_008039 [Sorochytrium milnesiophthora]